MAPDDLLAADEALTSRRGTVLVDPDLDARLDEDGFVVLTLPEVLELAPGLRDRYGELHGWSGSGFEADLNNLDLTYRRTVSGLLSEALDELVCRRFVDHTPFLRVFLCKWPGDDSDLYLHRDWMYIDERQGGSTYVVWIPLADVGPTDGPMQVLRGSHRLDPSLRGSNLYAPWIQHTDVLAPRMESVTVRLGEAVVMNNALLHSSLPNTSGSPRLVAAVGVHPADRSLVHFLAEAGSTGPAKRYDVDAEWFLRITPAALMAAPPDLPVKEEVDGSQREADPEQLARWLDTGVPPTPPDPAPTPAEEGAQAAPAGPAPEPAATTSEAARPAVVATRALRRAASLLRSLRR